MALLITIYRFRTRVLGKKYFWSYDGENCWLRHVHLNSINSISTNKPTKHVCSKHLSCLLHGTLNRIVLIGRKRHWERKTLSMSSKTLNGFSLSFVAFSQLQHHLRRIITNTVNETTSMVLTPILHTGILKQFQNYSGLCVERVKQSGSTRSVFRARVFPLLVQRHDTFLAVQDDCVIVHVCPCPTPFRTQRKITVRSRVPATHSPRSVMVDRRWETWHGSCENVDNDNSYR